MSKDESWRQEPWAKENMERWAVLRAKGFTFQNATSKPHETGVVMSHPNWKYSLTVYSPHNSETTRQEVYENWVEQCEFYVDCPSEWTDAARHILEKGKGAGDVQTA